MSVKESRINLPGVRSGSFVRYRSLVWNFTRRDLKSRFKGTSIGWLWSLLLPLATVVIYSIVFSLIIRVVPPDFGNGRTGVYAVWLLVGLVPWGFFSISVTSGMPSLLGTGALLQKIYFPSYVPVVSSVLTVLTQSAIEFAIVLGLLLHFCGASLTWLWVPLWIFALVVFATSLSYVFAVANVFSRDLAHLTTVFMQLLFFLTPIIYPLSQIPQEWKGIPVQSLMSASPVTQFVIVGRNLLYDFQLPSGAVTLYLLAWTAATALAAVYVFRRWGQDIGEAI